MKMPCLLLAALAGLAAAPASAEVLRAAIVGCSAPADAEKIAALQAKDRAAATAFSRPLVASRACIDFAKGIKIDVDERRAPLVCVRLPGDLSCYWVASAFIDDHPGEKASAGGRKGGRHH